MAKKKLTSALGIDVGSRQIKIAEVRMQGREPAITALGIAPTPEGAVDHTGVYDTDAISVVLKQLFSSVGVTVPHAVISIAGQASVLVRTLEVPRMNPGELKEHMRWEIERNIPFAESTVESDFQAFEPEDPAAQTLDVVMAISPQSAVETLVGLVKKSGKQTAAIDVEPLGMARALRLGYDEPLRGQTVCVVDVGHKTTAINMYRDGRLLMPRQVPIGGEMFTRAIADGLSVPFEDAERVKLERAEIPEQVSTGGGVQFAGPGPTQQFQPYNPFADDPAAFNPMLSTPLIPGPEEAAPADPTPVPVDTGAGADPEMIRIFNLMAPIVEEFVAEVRRSVDYFRSKGGEVHRIELVGGGAKLKGLPEFLSKALGIPTERLDPFRNLPISAKRLEPGLLEQHREEFAVAVGNALHIAF